MPSTTDIVGYLWGSRQWFDPAHREDEDFEVAMSMVIHNLYHSENTPQWFTIAFTPDGPNLVLLLRSEEEWERLFKDLAIEGMSNLARVLMDDAGTLFKMIDDLEDRG